MCENSEGWFSVTTERSIPVLVPTHPGRMSTWIVENKYTEITEQAVSAKLNELGAKLALAVIRGEMTADAATARLMATKKEMPCIAGRNGACLTHGQSLAECKR